MQEFWITWIWLNNALLQGSEYARPLFHRVLKKPPVLNMSIKTHGTGARRVTQGAEYAFNVSICICLNETEYNMIGHSGIYLKKQCAEQVCQNSECVMQHYSELRSLCKLLSSYQDKDVFRKLSNILRSSILQKEQYLSAGAQPENGVGGLQN